jgi:hypothetical protein
MSISLAMHAFDTQTEIEASIEEERAARQGLGLKEAFLGKGNGIRFLIAFGM